METQRAGNSIAKKSTNAGDWVHSQDWPSSIPTSCCSMLMTSGNPRSSGERLISLLSIMLRVLSSFPFRFFRNIFRWPPENLASILPVPSARSNGRTPCPRTCGSVHRARRGRGDRTPPATPNIVLGRDDYPRRTHREGHRALQRGPGGRFHTLRRDHPKPVRRGLTAPAPRWAGASSNLHATWQTRYPVIIWRTGTGYSAYSADVPGCAAAGDTKEGTRRNVPMVWREAHKLAVQKALTAHFKVMWEVGEPSPTLQSVTSDSRHTRFHLRPRSTGELCLANSRVTASHQRCKFISP